VRPTCLVGRTVFVAMSTSLLAAQRNLASMTDAATATKVKWPLGCSASDRGAWGCLRKTKAIVPAR